MSKMDNLRAMREARYEAAQKRGTGTPAKPAAKPVAKPEPGAKATPKRDPKAPEAAPAGVGTEELCGHRNMSGRTCTREKGHAAKSHRYS